MKEIYIGSILVKKEFSNMRHCPIAVEATSTFEAEGKMLHFARKFYPMSDGFHTHQVACQKIEVVLDRMEPTIHSLDK